MTREIIEAVRTIEREKGIDGDTLIQALEDALLAAYKKTPGASRHATVELDDEGDFRVYSIEIPADLEERLVEEARDRTIEELERLETETGEKNHTLLSDEDLELDWSQVPEQQIKPLSHHRMIIHAQAASPSGHWCDVNAFECGSQCFAPTFCPI